MSEAFIELLLFVVAVHRLDRRERELYFGIDEQNPWIPTQPPQPVQQNSSNNGDNTTVNDSSSTTTTSANPPEPAQSTQNTPTPAPVPVTPTPSDKPAIATKKELGKGDKKVEEEVKRAPFARFPRSKSSIIRMLAALLKRLPVIKHEYRSYNDYWKLLREMALMG